MSSLSNIHIERGKKVQIQLCCCFFVKSRRASLRNSIFLYAMEQRTNITWWSDHYFHLNYRIKSYIEWKICVRLVNRLRFYSKVTIKTLFTLINCENKDKWIFIWLKNSPWWIPGAWKFPLDIIKWTTWWQWWWWLCKVILSSFKHIHSVSLKNSKLNEIAIEPCVYYQDTQFFVCIYIYGVKLLYLLYYL